MNTIKEVMGVPSEVVKIIYDDCKKNKGIWVSYLLMLLGSAVILLGSYMAFHLTTQLMVAWAASDPLIAHDNPIPVVIWLFIILFTVELFKELYAVYKELRMVIIKGNR